MYFTLFRKFTNFFANFVSLKGLFSLFKIIFYLLSLYMDYKSVLIQLFTKYFGFPPSSVNPLAGAGSSRRYFRLSGVNPANPDVHAITVIGAYGDDKSENNAFACLDRVFVENNVPVPQVLAMDGTGTCYLQQDLGNDDLLSYIKNKEDDSKRLAGTGICESVMRILPEMQLVGEQEWSSFVAFPPMKGRQTVWDLNYFKYEFLKPSGLLFDESALEDDFESLRGRLDSIPEELLGFMWRDCQSRNVMVYDGKPFFIDFQGGRKGPGLYDAVSFAWQSRAGFTLERRLELVNIYAEVFANRAKELRGVSLSSECILKYLPDIVLLRQLQTLGAYGLRGLVERKAQFVTSIPAALANLRESVSLGWLDDYPTIKDIAIRFSEMPRFRPVLYDGKLHVKIFSFSYKKGYPEDLSGNGGGFMFDCRAMHNPGRYGEYKNLTGLDQPVIDFLMERGEIGKFMENVYSLVDPAVARYRQRGFTSLQIGFGCTGGQHRSVYGAQHLAEHLAGIFPDVVIELCHREQGNHQSFFMGRNYNYQRI